MEINKYQRFALTTSPCVLIKLKQAANEGGYEVLKSLASQAIWLQGGFYFSVSLLYAGIMGSVFRNHVGWNVAAGVGGLGILGTGWLLHRTIQQVVPLINAVDERQRERAAIELQGIQIPHQLQE